MEVIVSFIQQWTAPQVTILVGLAFVFYELLKTNEKLEQTKSLRESDLNYPFDGPGRKFPPFKGVE